MPAWTGLREPLIVALLINTQPYLQSPAVVFDFISGACETKGSIVSL